MVILKGQAAVKAHQFHFHAEQPNEHLHAGHAALFIKMLPADPFRLVFTVFVHAFNFQEDTLSGIVVTHPLQDLRTDAGTLLFFINSQIVQQYVIFTVDGNDQSGEFPLPGKPPYIAGTLEEHFHNQPERLFLGSRESFLIQFINICPLS